MSPPTRSDAVRLRVFVREHRYRLAAALVALAAAATVGVLSHELFPYNSLNHDEGVYLQQAAMLLEGKLYLTPGSEPLREAFHPWFFVESGRGLYSKYTPVTAAVFALGRLAGEYRLALVAVAAANASLCYAVTAAAFDRRTGVLAAAAMVAAPLFLLTSSVFLPYAPTTALNLVFALSYVRAVRRADVRYAALAGVAVGLAFFARPYTAVLFALPFVGHALWRVARAAPDDRTVVARHGVTAAFGLGGVGVTLAYNAVLTGDPLLFPYEAFAPLDGLGFGQRRILAHDVVYTPELALRANAAVLWAFATDWFTAGPLGTALAVAGGLAALVGIRRDGLDLGSPLSDRQLQAVLFGIAATVAVGNVYFWGNYNILADLADPDDGFVSVFGPFYHFDLLLPLSAFAAHGTLIVADGIRERAARRVSTRTVRVGTLVVLAVTLPVVGAAEASVLGPPVEKNAAHTEKLQRAYAPFESTDTANGLVFVPPEYGEWRNHPFQWLRNDPGFDGPTVYATARNPDDDFAVLDAYPDRRYFRYRYHGEWSPDPRDPVYPILERVRVRAGPELRARTTVTVPERVTSATVAVSNGETVHRYDLAGDPPGDLTVNWTLAPGGVGVEHPKLAPRTGNDAGPVPITGTDEIAVTVTIVEPSGATLTYREEVTVRTTGTGVEAVWPPETSVCTLVTECGLEGTYVPDRPSTRPSGIETRTVLVDGNA